LQLLEGCSLVEADDDIDADDCGVNWSGFTLCTSTQIQHHYNTLMSMNSM
jgi:hypothetical protein